MKIFVAKLDYNTDDYALEEAFATYGTVDSAKVIMDRDTGRSRGFGFVEMSNEEEARAAIKGLDGSDLDDREIVVKEAEDRGGNRGGGNNNRGGGGGYRGGGGRGRY